MSGYCPNHGPYSGNACPYPHQYEDSRMFNHAISELESSVAALAMLWVKDGPRRGCFYPVNHGTVIGREVADLILDDLKASDIHAKFTMQGGELVVWDFGSENGTYVNGMRIRKATLLEENDLVKIGDTSFVVKLLLPRQKRKTTSLGSKLKVSTKNQRKKTAK